MNIIQIAGHLGADPETRFTPSGLKVTNLRVATKIYRNGKEETVWYRVTIWGDRFDKMLTHMKKGSAIIVVGEMNKPEIYTDREGRPQISLEITAEFIRFSPFGKPGGQEGTPAAMPNTARGTYSAAPNPINSLAESSFAGSSAGTFGGDSHEEEEEIPF